MGYFEGMPGFEKDMTYSDVVDRQQSDAECIPERKEVNKYCQVNFNKYSVYTIIVIIKIPTYMYIYRL